MPWREMPSTWLGNSYPDSFLKQQISSGKSLLLSPPPSPPHHVFSLCSLGISMLEIACNMELPSGGHNWHRLRDGMLPHEFTRGNIIIMSIPARATCACENMLTLFQTFLRS